MAGPHVRFVLLYKVRLGVYHYGNLTVLDGAVPPSLFVHLGGWSSPPQAASQCIGPLPIFVLLGRVITTCPIGIPAVMDRARPPGYLYHSGRVYMPVLRAMDSSMSRPSFAILRRIVLNALHLRIQAAANSWDPCFHPLGQGAFICSVS